MLFKYIKRKKFLLLIVRAIDYFTHFDFVVAFDFYQKKKKIGVEENKFICGI